MARLKRLLNSPAFRRVRFTAGLINGIKGSEQQKKTLVSRRGQGGGRQARLEESAWEQWRHLQQTLPDQHWSSQQLAQGFYAQTGIRYSHSHWVRLLREGMYYYKPRPRDYRRPENAPRQLQQRIEATFDALQAMKFDLQRVKWEFSDEVAAQLTANNCRFWAFEPHLSRQVNTQRGSRSFFGFYGINAQSHLVSLADGKADSIRSALLAVKAQQVECDALVVFWDNASTHKALETWGWEHRIFFIPLPAYSPDLNPIEKVWKGTKRWVNHTHFVKELDELARLFHQGFDRLKDQLSFVKGWWENYQDDLSWYSPVFDSNTL